MEAGLVLQLLNETKLSGEGYKHGLRDHPSFCFVCTNFDRAVASELYGLDVERGLYLDNFSDGVTVRAKYEDIAEAAAEGCSSCLLLREVLIAFKGEETFECSQTGEVAVTYLEGTTMTVATVDEDGNQVDSFELFTDPGEPSPWSAIGWLIHTIDPYMSTPPWPGGTASRVSCNPDSAESYDAIRGWMAHCEREHPWCDVQSPWHANRRQNFIQIPSRLIFLGNGDGDLHLYENEDGIRGPTYLALSYCWGSNQGLVTTLENLEQMKQSIPFERLAKTCQDAVTITRRLNFKYLWIDSICIIQDDRGDWERESAAMGHIYVNAYLCIAATASRDSGSGIFKHRDITKTVSLIDIHGQESLLYVRKELPHGVFDWRMSDPTGLQFESSKRARDECPLFKRGWAFQERLLSLRILHYTRSELVWECLGSTSCECGTMSDYAGSEILQERKYIASIPRDIELRTGRLGRARELAKRFGHRRPEGYTLTKGSFMDSAMRRDFALWQLLSDESIDMSRTSLCSTTIALGVPRTSNHRVLTRYLFERLGERTAPKDTELQAGDRWHDIVSEYSRRALTFATDALPALSGLAAEWNDASGRRGEHLDYLAGLWRNSLQRDILWKYKDIVDTERSADYLAPTWSWASHRRTVGWIEASYSSTYQSTILRAFCDITGNVFGQVKYGYIRLHGPVLIGKVVTTHNLQQSSFALVKFGQGDGPNEHQFHVDSIPECARLGGVQVTVLWFCTDVQDRATQQGIDRALVLLKDASDEPTYTRIGVMERLDADKLVGWQDTEVIIT